MASIIDQNLSNLVYSNRETGFQHRDYNQQIASFEYLKLGDVQAVTLGINNFTSSGTGHLSDHPLRNVQYLFVCATTLACRFAIEGGLDAEQSFNISDVFIQRVDQLETIEQVQNLHREMMLYYTNAVAKTRKENIYSKPVLICIDYIQNHLHEPISGEILAKETDLSYPYLSSLFKKECNKNIHTYIQEERIKAAIQMLQFSKTPLSEISETLQFSSYSHFARVFKKQMNSSPKEYRDKNYQSSSMTKRSVLS